MAQTECVRVEEMRLLWFQWLFYRNSHPPSIRSVEDDRMNQRFRRRFREISERMGKKAWGRSVLDARSALLYSRCKKEWEAIQPRF